jgi:methyl-accepting chemotaxis protein
MLNVNTDLLLILGGVTVAVLLQAGFLMGMFLTMRKAVQMAKEQSEEYRAKLTPMIDNSSQLIATAKDLVTAAHTLINKVQPQVESVVTEVANMTHDVRAQVNQLQASVNEVAQKARRQADRVDSMTTSFLNGLDRFGTFVNEAVHVPIRQVNGVVAAAKAVVDALRSPAPARPRPRPAPQGVRLDEDKDLFV